MRSAYLAWMMRRRSFSVGVSSSLSAGPPPRRPPERLTDQRVLLEQALDVGRRHVLAAGGDDQLLLAVHDPQVAVLVQLADVAGVQPAVLVDQLPGGLLLPEVA